MRGDVTGSGGGEMAQPFSCQLDGVPAASRRTACAQTPVVAHSENAEAQRVLDVRYDNYTKKSSAVRPQRITSHTFVCKLKALKQINCIYCSAVQPL